MTAHLLEIPEEKTFTMLIGLPATGKSTFAEKMMEKDSNNRVVISSDKIRFDVLNYEETGIDFDPKAEPRVWAIIDKKVEEALLESTSRDVVFDATNLTRAGRRRFLILAKRLGYRTRGIIFSTSLTEIKKRNLNRERDVPEDVIERFYYNAQYPEKGEFDELFEINT